MTKVEFAQYPFRFREENGRKQIFDPLRKKFVALTPEEWVRQHVLHYLLALGYPASLMAVERGIEVNNTGRRFDLLVFGADARPFIIVECKAQSEAIDHSVMLQAAAYNLALQASYCWLTNGDRHFFIRLSDGKILDEIPAYSAA